MKTNLNFSKPAGRLVGTLGFIVILAAFIFYIFFSTNADAFNMQVAGCIFAAALCEGISIIRPAGILSILSCAFLSAGSVLFVRSILSSLVNYFTGVTMFGGTNQYGQIFAVIVLIVTSLLLELISSFLPRVNGDV